MVPVIEPESSGHDCWRYLPRERGGYGSTGHPEGTLITCPVCDRWFKCVPRFESLGPIDAWTPVRWYHRGSLRRIAETAGAS